MAGTLQSTTTWVDPMLDPENLGFQRVKNAFLEVLPLSPELRERRLLELFPDDPALREETEKLVLRHNSDSFPSPPFEDSDLLRPDDVFAGSFKIIRFINQGGMGAVYEAEHLHLGGRVALKTLRPDLSDNPIYERYLRHEIHNAHRVQHENVCPIYDLVVDSGRNNAIAFTMELLEGETLRERIEREKSLSSESALPLVEQIAAGLDAMHREGIVHCDLKPDNIVIVRDRKGDERVKITDFGISCAVEEGEGGSTRVVAPVGTFGYMAPEVVKGKGPTPASDIYSFGVVIREMITGNRHASTDVLLDDDGHPVGNPCWLSAIRRCLRDQPDERPRRARPVVEVIKGAELADLVLAALAVILALIAIFLSAPSKARIAVLPFSAEGTNRELVETASSLTETLTSRLSIHTLPEGLVVAPASEVKESGVTEPGPGLGPLKARYAFQGILQEQDFRIELTISLIDTEKMNLIDSEVVRGKSGDTFGLQDRAVDIMAGMLDRMSGLGDHEDPRGYSAYLRGRKYLLRFDVEGNLDRAIAAFEQALQRSPDYASAYAGLAEAYIRIADQTRDASRRETAREFAEKAVELDPMLAYARFTLGIIQQRLDQHERAAAEFRMAISLNRFYGDAHRELAKVYEALGRVDEAEQEFEQVEPKDWRFYLSRGVFHYNTSRLDKAAEDLTKVTELNPTSHLGFFNLGGVYVAQGRYSEAAQQFQAALPIQRDARTYNNLGTCFYFQGLFPEAADAFRETIKFGGNRYRAWGNLADAQHWGFAQQEAKESYETAIQQAKQLLDKKEHDETASVRVAEYQAKLGNCEDSLASLSGVPEQERHDVDALARKGLVYALCGQPSSALNSLKNAIDGGYPVNLIEHDQWFADVRRSDWYQTLKDEWQVREASR